MRKHLLPIFLIFIFSLWSLQSLFQSGFMYSHDSLWHVERIQNISTLIPEQFPVRWSPTLDNGFGIPLFNFAYPAPYYLGAVFMFLGLGTIKAYYTLIFLSYFLGGVGVYLLGHRHRFIGITASLLYLLAPYQFLDIFVRGALGEVVALGLFPWIILSYQQLSKSGKLRWYSSVPMALLLLSHNFYAYLFSGLMAFLTLTFYKHRLKIILSYLFSLALSAFFLLPAFFERSYLLIAQAVDYGFEAHFVFPPQLLYSPWSYLGSLPGNNQTEMSYQLGLASLLVLALSLIYLLTRIVRRQLPRRLTVLTLAFFFVIFMTLPSSLWFWHSLPLVSSLQFPWRFLGLATILIPLIYLSLAKLLAPKKPRLFLIFSLTLVLLALVNTRNYHRPVQWLSGDEFLALHYEYVGKTTTAHRDELVPRWATKERWKNGPSLIVDDGVELRDLTESAYQTSFWATSPDSELRAISARNYYPSWYATRDGEPLLISPSDTGEVIIPLTDGEHYYQLALASTRVATFANFLSLFSLAILGMIIWKGKSK